MADDEKAIGMVPLQVMGCRCRCGHEWLPQGGERPRVCPKCKSPNWDRPKRWTRKAAEGGADKSASGGSRSDG